MSSAPHGRLFRSLIAITASLSLVVGVATAAGAVRWVQLRDIGTDPPLTKTDKNGNQLPTSNCATEPCNYLLLGSDSRAGLNAQQTNDFGNNADIGGANRADTIMLVHTDPALQKAIVLSFPRDLWVHIPGHGMNKINAAFEGGLEHGGPQLLAQTITDLTGLSIDHYLYVDLNGFEKVVDTLGGVDMCIPAYNVNTPGWVDGNDAQGNVVPTYYSEVGHIVDPNTGLDIVPGCQRLSGLQALAYVRTRHLPCDFIPDFSRIGRQQQFMRSVINQMLSPSEIVKAPGLVSPVLASLHRDRKLLPGDLVYLVGQLRGISTGAVEFRAVPGDPFAKVGSQDVVLMDPSAKEIFKAISEGKPITGVGTQLVNTPPSEANTTVAVIDANSGGKAAGVEDTLVRAGFDVSPGIWDASKVPPKVTGAAIVYRPGQQAYANLVATYFPGLKLVSSAALHGAPVAIVVPASYHPQKPSSGGATGNQCPNPTA
ncbi:MAG TPA: LCP family protein [Actinomycetota bacterium]|nr:LCP family protein [Actinomycetota bacterium]